MDTASQGWRLHQTRGDSLPAWLVPPHGGMILPWPYSGEPGDTSINCQAAQRLNGGLRITQGSARIEIDVPAAVRRTGMLCAAAAGAADTDAATAPGMSTVTFNLHHDREGWPARRREILREMQGWILSRFF